MKLLVSKSTECRDMVNLSRPMYVLCSYLESFRWGPCSTLGGSRILAMASIVGSHRAYTRIIPEEDIAANTND